MIKAHFQESDKPDLEVVLKSNQSIILLFVEVTGTSIKGGMIIGRARINLNIVKII